MKTVTLFLSLILVSISSSCITTSGESDLPELDAEEISRHIRPQTKDRLGWARDIRAAIDQADLPATIENVCSVIAVIEQESGYQVDPVVPNLPKIVRLGLLEKLSRLGPLAEPALKVFLSGTAPGETETFAQRVDKLRTERDLDRLFRDIAEAYRENRPGSYFIATALSKLLGKGTFSAWNPITTAGSMQVKISYAHDLDYFEGLTDAELREKLFTRSGGVVAGTDRLLAFDASYDDVVYRFSDFNAGVYASRNAAFQSMLSELTGLPLDLDGDLLAYDKNGKPTKLETKTLQAMLKFGRANRLSDRSVRKAAAKEKSIQFEDSAIWEKVRENWLAKTGKEPAYTRIPNVELVSPKLSGKKTTGWFAANVKRRYQACRLR